MDKSMQLSPSMNPKGSAEVSIASSIIPWPRDDERALYLGYRASGLSVRESLHMIERSKPWLSLQRHDDKFVELENKIPDFRRELSKEYVEIEFFRNFRLALEKDYQVLRKSISKGEVLTRQEHEYLLKLRTQYSPAQIQILEAVVSGNQNGFNFAAFVAEHPDIVQLSRTDTVTVARGRRGISEG
jgi:hypothetical protein